MMSAKLATLGRFEIKFWRHYFYCVINKILSRNSNYIVDSVKWPTFGNSSIGKVDLNVLNFIRIWTEETFFLRGALGSSSIVWDWHYVWSWNFTKCGKGDVNKNQKDLVVDSCVCKLMPLSWIKLRYGKRHLNFILLILKWQKNCQLPELVIHLKIKFTLVWTFELAITHKEASANC